MTPNPTLIEQVKKVAHALEASDGVIVDCAGMARYLRLARVAIATYEATLQGSAALPSEALLVREAYATFLDGLGFQSLAAETRAGTAEVPTYPRQLVEAGVRTAMRATTPTAPDQDTATVFALGNDDADAFEKALNNPPEPNEELRKLL